MRGSKHVRAGKKIKIAAGSTKKGGPRSERPRFWAFLPSLCKKKKKKKDHPAGRPTAAASPPAKSNPERSATLAVAPWAKRRERGRSLREAIQLRESGANAGPRRTARTLFLKVLHRPAVSLSFSAVGARLRPARKPRPSPTSSHTAGGPPNRLREVCAKPSEVTGFRPAFGTSPTPRQAGFEESGRKLRACHGRTANGSRGRDNSGSMTARSRWKKHPRTPFCFHGSPGLNGPKLIGRTRPPSAVLSSD